jgi:uncharacterized protein DUF3362
MATCIYYTGIDPFTRQEVYVARQLRDRKLPRALLHFFKPENYLKVRMDLEEAGRTDLIGSGCDCLISPQLPREALAARRKQANQTAHGDYVHTIPKPAGQGRGGEATDRDARPPAARMPGAP